MSFVECDQGRRWIMEMKYTILHIIGRSLHDIHNEMIQPEAMAATKLTTLVLFRKDAGAGRIQTTRVKEIARPFNSFSGCGLRTVSRSRLWEDRLFNCQALNSQQFLSCSRIWWVSMEYLTSSYQLLTL